MNLPSQRVGRFLGPSSRTPHSAVRFRPAIGRSIGCVWIAWGKILVGDDPGSADERFVWSTERYRLTLWFEEDQWAIQHTAPNPLLGPLVVSEARHRQAKQAVWEVMKRVARATRDDEEGVRVASSAARWMRQLGESRSLSLRCD